MHDEKRTLYDFMAADNPARYEAIDSDNATIDTLTIETLREQSLRLASALKRFACQGDRVIIPPLEGLDFERAFFATIAAGMIAVPLPKMPTVASKKLRRVESVLADCDAKVVIASEDDSRLIVERTGIHSLDPAAAHDTNEHQPIEPVARHPDDVVLLQYTSGSTGEPKGVEISQANLIVNQLEMSKRCDITPKTDIVSWLPSYHDMGLCSMVILPLVTGARVVKMQTADFIRRPLLWLEAMSGREEIWSAAPDFAYRTCLQALQRANSFTADLSGWRFAANASEPVRESTMQTFEAAMSPYGFPSTAFHPGYGLAESTVCVSVNPPGVSRSIIYCDPEQLGQGVAVPVAASPTRAPIVGCGRPIDDSHVAIMALDEDVILGEGVVGEVCIAGRSNARGYWNKPGISQRTFGIHVDGRSYLRTGDIAFIHKGEIFICGRKKDLIILGGENYFPSDVEADVAEQLPELSAGTIAAFQGETDEVVVAFEAPAGTGSDVLEDLCKQVVRAASQAYPGRLYAAAVRRGRIPKTTSGKIQRSRCRDLLATGALSPLQAWPERN